MQELPVEDEAVRYFKTRNRLKDYYSSSTIAVPEATAAEWHFP